MSKALLERAREFRKKPTRGESVVWNALRNRALGVRFYRQKPIGVFVPDFVCERPPLIIEIDGPVHEEQIERDAERQRYLEEKGYRVLRFTAHEAEFETAFLLQRTQRAIEEERRKRIDFHKSRNEAKRSGEP